MEQLCMEPSKKNCCPIAILCPILIYLIFGSVGISLRTMNFSAKTLRDMSTNSYCLRLIVMFHQSRD